MTMADKPILLDMDLAELGAFLTQLGEPRFAPGRFSHGFTKALPLRI